MSLQGRMLCTTGVMMLALLLLAGTGSNAETTVRVTRDDMVGWRYMMTSGDGFGQFVLGPDTPPLGEGSLRLSSGTHGHLSAQLRHQDFHGTRLADLTALSYWSFATEWDGQRLPTILLNIDLNGDGIFDMADDDILVFDPVYQNPVSGNPLLPAQAPAQLEAWQHWDALAGGWWSLQGIAGATPGVGVKSLQEYLAAVPHATIINTSEEGGGLRLVVGFGVEGDVFDAYVDALTVGIGVSHATYDFAYTPEPTAVDIDIDPIRYPNPIDMQHQHFVSVAILSTPEFFAPHGVDPASLTFGRQGGEASLAGCHPEPVDVNEDGLPDLVCDFTVAATGFQCEDTDGILRGFLTDGTRLEGMDAVLIEPCP